MDRLSHLRGEAGGSRDSTLDTTSPPSESFMTANESSSKYFSLSEVDDSTFDISSIKDVSLASTTTDSEGTITNTEELISNLSPIGKKSDMLDSYKIGKQIEAANILSGGVDIFDDNDNSYDGDELVIDDNVDVDDKSNSELKQQEGMIESTLINEETDIASKDTEVVLQIDGKNVDAIDIGNGLYLYRKEGQEELAAVQIIDDEQQQTSFKFLKVRENVEGNLEVYEEIEIEVPKEVPVKEGRMADKKISSHVPIKDINKVISESACNKVADRKTKSPRKEPISTTTVVDVDVNKESSPDAKSEVNINGKMMKFSESRKSPVIGSFTPMTYHSTPNKEGIPLTKTMVDQQLHPNRHSDNVKKTIEVHTDSSKQRISEISPKNKDGDDNKTIELLNTGKELVIDDSVDKITVTEETVPETNEDKNDNNKAKPLEVVNDIVLNYDDVSKGPSNLPKEQDNVIDSTENESSKEKPILEEHLPSEIVNKEKEGGNDKNLGMMEEKMAIDSVVIETAKENVIDKVKENIEKPIIVESENETKVYSIAKINKEMVIENSEPIQVNKESEKVMKMNVSDKKNKLIIKDNTPGDIQEETKVSEIIYDISTDPVDEILIIDDTELGNSKIEEQLSSIEKMDTKPEDMKNENQKTSNQENTKNKIYVEPSVLDNDKKHGDNIQADSTSIITSTYKENNKNDVILPLSENTNKSNQSKIPIPKAETNKITPEPSCSKSTNKESIFKPVCTKQEKVELKSESAEKPAALLKVVKDEVDKAKTQKKIIVAQSTAVKLPKKEDKPEFVSKVVTNKTPSDSKPKEDDMLETDPKKEPKKPDESQPAVVPVVVDSSTNIKVEIAADSTGKVPNVEKEQKPIATSPSKLIPYLKAQEVPPKDEKQDAKLLPKGTTTDNSVKEVHVNTVLKEEEPQPSCSGTQDISITSTDSIPSQSNENKNESEDNRDDSNGDDAEPGTSKKAVPFGKWTATNRKEFLIKIKNRTTVTPATPSTSSNQLKNSNDLNRRDVLQKIDSQRQSSNAALAKTQEANKLMNKNETAFVNKNNIIQNKDTNQESKITAKTETVKEISGHEVDKTSGTPESINTAQNEATQVAPVTNIKKDPGQRTEVNYQDLIDKTIEDMIHRTVVPLKPGQDEPNQASGKDASQTSKFPHNYPTDQATLDEIEMKMNELHGIPFIERPPHELPVVPITEPKLKTYAKVEKDKTLVPNKTTKIPNLLPFSNKPQQKIVKDNIIEVDSEEEIIEHEPITGDINKKTVAAKPPPKEKVLSYANSDKSNTDLTKKESIITEKDFDKFARRNSITCENCLTVNFDGKEPHNVIQTVVQKEPYPKSYSKNDITRVDPKAKLPHKYQNVRHSIQPAKVYASNKFGTTTEDSSNRNQSKLQKAYQSALSAKRQMEFPISIIEDKPVKVVFMDNMDFVPSPLNVQGQELSPAKKLNVNPDALDSEVLDTTDDSKSQEEVKTKTKHQRKQVLTPVEEPELELIEPKDLGLEVSPKKKRKTDEAKSDKDAKYPMRKKYYLLGSNAVAEEKYSHTSDVIKNPLKETVNLNDNGVPHKNPVSAIDSLVKAAELLENQSENMIIMDSSNPDSQQSTPVKRGRGRPRKYPLPEGGDDKNKVPSPQKKPRLIDAKVPKREVTTTDDDDDDDSDDQIIKENWTMGKINENIVCPICNKLFRTENVVFKHVKHCTGPSPSRSDSDKRSPRRMRSSQESDCKSRGSKSDDMDIDDDKPLVVRKETPKKRISRDSIAKLDDQDEVIVIEDTPIKEKQEKKEKEIDERKVHESRKPRAKIIHKSNDLICEFCGKTFRQLSYLVSHKLQHKKDESKKTEKEVSVTTKSVYSCEVCKKEFRKLHHLVQHRIIHNPSSVPARSLRKSSSEQCDTKVEPATSKQTEDPSAGFRCEPCDKSFRKLHHLVEHRETHDGINRQKITPVIQNNVEKPVSLHQCEVCKKTFRKLHHLIEHKEQHVETSSEKSDDKSVKSSLSTRDIIHECSLCYMVFPNEHSLNKHTIICLRKKKSKQAKPMEESETVESVEEVSENSKLEEKLNEPDPTKLVIDEIDDDGHITEAVENKEDKQLSEDKPDPTEVKIIEIDIDNDKDIEKEKEIVPRKAEIKPIETVVVPTKRDVVESENVKPETKPEVPEKIKKVEVKETVKVHEMPKKKISSKDKSLAHVNKRLKTTAPDPVQQDPKPVVESSDDEEVRYMLNPKFKVEDTSEEKVFMKVRENKRSSLQIERPNSKDLVKRRTSLQHPPKIPRLKPKAIEPSMVAVKHIAKAPKLEPVPSTDSDDSETVKYSFPKTIPEKSTKLAQDRTPLEKKTQKKTLADKRKSLSGIAKRKSLGKAVTARHKPSPMKQIKRRTLEVEHRCDCGQLFSSAALLSRHTTLAHTPPRIRRRRSPPPDEKPLIKPAPRKTSVPDKPKQTPASRKSSARSESSTSTNTKPNKSEVKATRKSLETETKTPADTRKLKPDKSEVKSSVKPKRTGAHRGVPVPEKMRKLMQKNNK